MKQRLNYGVWQNIIYGRYFAVKVKDSKRS